MANLKEIRTRLASVTTTRQITSAMKMVSAAKLRRAQDAILQMRPYYYKLQDILTDVSKSTESKVALEYTENRELKRALLIVITSNKGLCGGFNSNIVKQTIQNLTNKYKELHERGAIDIMAIGKKGAEQLKAKGFSPTTINGDLLESLQYEKIKIIAEELVSSFLRNEYDLIELYYNKFKNASTQAVTEEQYLPVSEPEEQRLFEENIEYILEPSKETIITRLVPKALEIQLYKALLESVTSEHGARMTAMHKATDNATEIIKELKLEYNKARQAAITNEILEIVGGADALKS